MFTQEFDVAMFWDTQDPVEELQEKSDTLLEEMVKMKVG